jgi:hypothetical protein
LHPADYPKYILLANNFISGMPVPVRNNMVLQHISFEHKTMAESKQWANGCLHVTKNLALNE